MTGQWTIEELVATTQQVQSKEINIADKILKIQWMELTEEEEPKVTGLVNNMSEDEKNNFFQKAGVDRVLEMIEKANKANPEGANVSRENWPLLPSVARTAIINNILADMGGKNDLF